MSNRAKRENIDLYNRALNERCTVRGYQVRPNPDRLARKPAFACGEAAKRGWAVMIWNGPVTRGLYLERFRKALAAREVLPLPG